MAEVKRLTIFEGSDGSGKSTAAQRFADETGARYVHCGPYKQVKQNLGRFYAEALLPAVLGYQDVVLDRCWLSEVPYGTAFRGGADRLGDVQRRLLERLAFRCATLVVNCRPAWDTVRTTFASRLGDEMLEREDQLRQVYDLYGERLPTALPQVRYDYQNDPDLLLHLAPSRRSLAHRAALASAGDLEARVLLVGEAFGEVKEPDLMYQWPFASFSGLGCSQWLTQQLADAGISESALTWINADQDLAKFFRELWPDPHLRTVVALGQVASTKLTELGVHHHTVDHPQAWKRFHASEDYPLINLLEEIC